MQQVRQVPWRKEQKPNYRSQKCGCEFQVTITQNKVANNWVTVSRRSKWNHTRKILFFFVIILHDNNTITYLYFYKTVSILAKPKSCLLLRRTRSSMMCLCPRLRGWLMRSQPFLLAVNFLRMSWRWNIFFYM